MERMKVSIFFQSLMKIVNIEKRLLSSQEKEISLIKMRILENLNNSKLKLKVNKISQMNWHFKISKILYLKIRSAKFKKNHSLHKIFHVLFCRKNHRLFKKRIIKTKSKKMTKKGLKISLMMKFFIKWLKMLKIFLQMIHKIKFHWKNKLIKAN